MFETGSADSAPIPARIRVDYSAVSDLHPQCHFQSFTLVSSSPSSVSLYITLCLFFFSPFIHQTAAADCIANVHLIPCQSSLRLLVAYRRRLVAYRRRRGAHSSLLWNVEYLRICAASHCRPLSTAHRLPPPTAYHRPPSTARHHRHRHLQFVSLPDRPYLAISLCVPAYFR